MNKPKQKVTTSCSSSTTVIGVLVLQVITINNTSPTPIDYFMTRATHVYLERMLESLCGEPSGLVIRQDKDGTLCLMCWRREMDL